MPAKQTMSRLLALLAMSLMLSGCISTPSSQRWVRSEVFFGLSRPNGSHITPGEWQAFMDEEVTPKFPAGLSVVDSAGQWRNASGHIDREPSKVLVLLHPRITSIEKQIDAIRRSYCERFQQEAVMKVTTFARVTFN
jgi:hypothetical protein